MQVVKKISVIGRVQGVFFRHFTRLKAEELGVVGTVLNKDDGSVEIFAKGDSLQLSLFIQWCHHGSPMSRVDIVRAEEVNEDLDFDSFEIIR